MLHASQLCGKRLCRHFPYFLAMNYQFNRLLTYGRTLVRRVELFPIGFRICYFLPDSQIAAVNTKMLHSAISPSPSPSRQYSQFATQSSQKSTHRPYKHVYLRDSTDHTGLAAERSQKKATRPHYDDLLGQTTSWPSARRAVYY